MKIRQEANKAMSEYNHDNTADTMKNEYTQVPPETRPGRFKADRIDAVFSLITFVLGYFFVDLMIAGQWRGIGVTVFTVMYLAVSLIFFRLRGHKFGFDAVISLLCCLLVGLSYAFWGEAEFDGWRGLFLFFSAAYWTITACGMLADGKTGSLLFYDVINMLFIIPFVNFVNCYRAFAGFKTDRVKVKSGKKTASIFIGIGIGLLLIIIVLPLLLRADSGAFSKLFKGIAEAILDFIFKFLDLEFLWKVFIAVPIAMYIFGLFYGAAHKRSRGCITSDGVRRAGRAVKLLRSAAVLIPLYTLAALFLLYIVCQVPYLFSAFGGQLPEGAKSVTDYARDGFFELCGISAFTLSAIIALNIFSLVPFRQSKMLQAVNSILSALTIILIASAFSKLALYIETDGLTMKRVLPAVFMGLMTLVFVLIIIYQRKEFNITKAAVAAACVIMVGMSLWNIDAMVIRSNVSRYQNGDIALCSIDLFYRSGYAGVKPAIELLESGNITDTQERALIGYLSQFEGRLDPAISKDFTLNLESRSAIIAAQEYLDAYYGNTQ